MTIDSVTIASWVEISITPEQGTIELTFNRAKVAASLKSFAQILELSAKPSVSTLLNGSLAGMNSGSAGRTLRFDELVDQVVKSTDWSTQSITAHLDSVLPAQATVHRYSRDDAGIQSLINHWAILHQKQYAVYFQTLDGRIRASLNPNSQHSSGGLNRLYIAHLVYGRLNANTLKPSTSTGLGISVQGCLEQMLVASHQACFLALGDIVGWNINDSLILSQGFEGTIISRGNGYTTAKDLADWLIKMNGSSLVTRTQTNSILSMMTRSTRQGAAAASPGITVASSTGDKHQAAIVFHNRAPYVLSVLSAGDGNLSEIAELTREINRVLNE